MRISQRREHALLFTSNAKAETLISRFYEVLAFYLYHRRICKQTGNEFGHNDKILSSKNNDYNGCVITVYRKVSEILQRHSMSAVVACMREPRLWANLSLPSTGDYSCIGYIDNFGLTVVHGEGRMEAH